MSVDAQRRHDEETPYVTINGQKIDARDQQAIDEAFKRAARPNSRQLHEALLRIRMSDYLEHHTQETGDTRRSPRTEVHAETVHFLRPMLAQVLDPGQPEPLRRARFAELVRFVFPTETLGGPQTALCVVPCPRAPQQAGGVGRCGRGREDAAELGYSQKHDGPAQDTCLRAGDLRKRHRARINR